MSEPIHPDAHYGSAEVAHLLFGITVETFYNRRKELAAEAFPAPICPKGHPRWRGADLLAWRARPRADDTPLQGETLVDIRHILRLRSRAMAQPGRRRLSR